MAEAYECDRCKVTILGEARGTSDSATPGTPFTLRFSFGMARPQDEQEKLTEEAEEHPLIKLMGIAKVNTDAIENYAADLCDPCRATLLRDAVELAGLELHESA